MYSVILPSTKLGGGNKKDGTVYLRQLDDASVIRILKENPTEFPDEQRILNMIFDEKFYNLKAPQRKLSGIY